MKAKVFVLFLIVFFLFVPSFALAQAPLVPCGTDSTPPCQFCHLIELVQRVINFIIVYLAAPVATLLIAYAGIKLIINAEKEDERKKARQLLWDILVGFLWILFAWTAVLAVINLLVGDDVRSPNSTWFKIECFAGYAAQDFRTYQGGNLGTTPILPQDCSTCITLSSEFNIKTEGLGACSGGGQCKVSSSLAVPLVSLKTNLNAVGIDTTAWQITEAWPPTVVHQNECHRSGTCIDANLLGNNSTPENIAKFSDAAFKSNLRAVYEVKTQEHKDTIVSKLPKNSNVEIMVVSTITAPHFSVYKKN